MEEKDNLKLNQWLRLDSHILARVFSGANKYVCVKSTGIQERSIMWELSVQYSYYKSWVIPQFIFSAK